jgi:hypothetical protein
MAHIGKQLTFQTASLQGLVAGQSKRLLRLFELCDIARHSLATDKFVAIHDQLDVLSNPYFAPVRSNGDEFLISVHGTAHQLMFKRPL